MKGLTFKEFLRVLKRVLKKHRLIEGRNIKYVNLTIDLRDFNVFQIDFRSYGPTTKKFHTSKGPNSKRLIWAITKWLKSGETKNENHKTGKTNRKNRNK